MVFKEGLTTEIKFGKIVLKDGAIIVEEYDKDENILEEHLLSDLFEPYTDKEYIKIKLEYGKEL